MAGICEENALMKFYTSDGCSYEGIDQDTITRLRTELGRDTAFITEEEYNAFIAAQPRPQ